jgi:predicted transcriptional regulator
MSAAKEMSAIGELESEVLSVLEQRGSSTASEVLDVLKDDREIAYTTVSTTLDRLYKKNLVGRKGLPGPGGIKYLFTVSGDQRLKNKIIEATLDRLTNAFGDAAYSAIYKQLQTLSPSDLDRLKRQVDKAKKSH